ncbi:thioredoxin-like protein [Blastocladiella britannica]|nr:thioredoxin-like protein [Blastocladiella britannica]
MEDTEWNDILRARGILPNKSGDVEVTEDDLAAIVDAAATAAFSREGQLDRATLDELAELEDEEDDRVLESYRRRRMAEMKDAASRKRFGEVTAISKPDFVREVSDASKECWVVCYLYKDSIPACKLLTAILSRVAAAYRETKFVKIIGDQCIPNYPDRNLPTLVIYHGGDMIRQIVGMQAIPGGMGTTIADVERLLLAVGAVQKSARETLYGETPRGGNDDDDEDDEDAVERRMRSGGGGFKVVRGGDRRAGGGHDNDSDSDY